MRKSVRWRRERERESEGEEGKKRNTQEDHAKGVVPLRETKVEEYEGRCDERRRRGRT